MYCFKKMLIIVFACSVFFAQALTEQPSYSSHVHHIRNGVHHFSSISEHNQSTSLAIDATANRFIVVFDKKPTLAVLTEKRAVMVDPNEPVAASELKQYALSYKQQLMVEQGAFIQKMQALAPTAKVHHQFSQVINALSISGKGLTAQQLQQMPRVKRVYDDQKVFALLDTSVERTEAPQVWAMRTTLGETVTGKGVTVAVIDTGIDYLHPDLGGCFGQGCKVVGGYDFVNDDADPMDDNGHGTHVAGIVAANGLLTGVAPDALLYAYKSLDAGGSGWDSWIIAAIEHAVAANVDIINMSLGGGGGFDSPMSMATNQAALAGVLMVVAAGNSGPAAETVGSPGNAEHAFTVGAVNNTGDIAGFSSRGPVPGASFIKPDIVAPGVAINAPMPNGEYARLSGTSMAAPHVAGGAALLKQLFPAATEQDLKQLLFSHTRDLGFAPTVQGAGELTLYSAANPVLQLQQHSLFFGRIDHSKPQWQAKKFVQFKNVSTSTQEVNFALPVSFPAGLTLTGLPAGAVMLPAGQTYLLELTLTADNRVLGFPDTADMLFKAMLKLTASGKEYNVALNAEKALQLSITSADSFIHWLFVHDTLSGTVARYPIFDVAGTVKLAPSVYNFFVYSDSGTVDRLLLQQGVNLQQDRVLAPEAFSYPNSVSLNTVLDEQMRHLTKDDLQTHSTLLNIRLQVNEQQFERFAVGNLYPPFYDVNRDLAFSDIPDNMKVQFQQVMADRSDPSHHKLYYFDHVSAGLDTPITHNLIAAEASKMQYVFDNNALYDDGFHIVHNVIESLPERGIISAFGISFEMLYAPYRLTLYGASAQLADDMYAFSLNARDAQFAHLAESGAIALTGDRHFYKLGMGFLDYGQRIMHAGKAAELANLPMLYSNHLVHRFPGQLVAYTASSFFTPGFRNEFLSFSQQDNRFLVYCGEQLQIESSVFSSYSAFQLPDNCQRSRVEFAADYQWQHGAATYSMTGELADFQSLAALESVIFYNDNFVSRVLDSQNPSMLLRVAQADTVIRPNVFIKFASQQTWQKLDIEDTLQDGAYVVKLPVVNAGGLASIKIEVTSSSGNLTTHLLQNAIFLQRPTHDQALDLDLAVVGSGSVSFAEQHCHAAMTSCQSTHVKGDQVTLQANPAAGNRFIRWEGNACGSSRSCTVTMDASKQLTAVFAPLRYSPAVSFNGEGEITAENQVLFYGAKQRFTVNAAAGFKTRKQVKGTCPKGVWLDNTTYETGSIVRQCSVGFEFYQPKRSGLPFWLYLVE